MSTARLSRQVVYGRNGMVCTNSPLSAAAGLKVLQEGGNAFDAALAVAATETVTMVPNFLTVSWLHRVSPIPWLNNWPALTIPFMVSAFSIFLLRQFMRGIPGELYEAARIDGAGHLRFLFQIVLPLCRAPLLTVGMFTFIGSWNALGWPLLVTNTPHWRPIAVALQKFVTEAGPEVHLQMAGAVIATLPVLVIYALVQKEFTEGISMSGLKG